MPLISHLIDLAARADTEVVEAPFSTSAFTLDSSGVAGFFGGDTAVSGMATVHLMAGRRWCGWYNAPGAYEVAKQYGQLANSRFWDGLYPGAKCEPAELFGLDGKIGPPFHAARSGSSILRTGHLAYLIARKARDMDDERTVVVKGRETTPQSVTVIDLQVPSAGDGIVHPSRIRNHSGWYAIIPIVASVATCVLCALAGDWWCFGNIALGMFTSGVACLIIGSGRLTFSHPKPANGAPRGDGILVDDGAGVIVLRGDEAAVNSLTRGRFSLELKFGGKPRYSAIGYASILLTVQFLVQLVLIPQGTLFGQVMFVTSLAVSWMYNMYLSSLDKEDRQTAILMKVLRLEESDLRKFLLGSRTAMAVFSQSRMSKLLHDLIPNDTEVWQRWRELVADRLSRQQSLTFTAADWAVHGFDADERSLLEELLKDAQDAYEGWKGAVSVSGDGASMSTSSLKGVVV
ncbi:hypothetical protein C8Q74DRAFT_1315314 [Fomes fomentarius]|nr:hypothetical protein C8Q74DRAFT_1315314 [Fomes fomentarius]